MDDYKINEFDKYKTVYKALSDQTRLKIMWLLNKIDSKICVSEIIEVFEENQYNVSKHLKILKNSGLVYEKREGRWVFYQCMPPKDEFMKNVYQTVVSIPDSLLEKEIRRCKCLLENRVDRKRIIDKDLKSKTNR